jgi:hypothetical protein
MEPNDSLPCWEEPSTGTYPEPNQPNPYHTILSLKMHFNIINPPTSYLLSGLFPSRFPTNILHAFLFSPIHATCPAHLILLDLI